MCEIDKHCVELVTWFNKIGLKTVASCQGDEHSFYHVLFSEEVTDEDIDELLLMFYKEYGIVQHYGSFEKWKRCFNGNIITSWKYTCRTIEKAYADYEMFSRLK